MMPVDYYLRPNKLGRDGKTFMANVISRGTMTEEDVIKQILYRGSTVTRADIISVLCDYHDCIEYYLQNGYNVKTPLANFSSSIRGIFKDNSDYYQNRRHKIYPVLNPGRRLLRFYRERMTAHIVRPNTNIPEISEFIDLNSGFRNSLVTAGGMGKINGRRLKIDSDSEYAGIFFIDQQRRTTKVQVIGTNAPSQLLFIIPANLEEGDYTLEVRGVIKNLRRSGRLSETLQVQNISNSNV
jgi:hypothetical protein